MVIRKEIGSHHHIYDIDFNGSHYYVYGFPYYNNLYTGRMVYPDGEKFYLITSEEYVRIMTLYSKDKRECEDYCEANIDVYIISTWQNANECKFCYLGDMVDFFGHQNSAVIQALVRYLYDKSS